MINWGIIGAGRIAHRFAQGLKYEENSRLWAISGRDKQKLESFAQEYSCEKIYTDYQDIIDDPQIDAVYIALPNKYHFWWSKKALENKKSVLCEKPAVVDIEQAREIIKIAKENDALFMEAMKSLFVPAYDYILKKLAEGIIGDIEEINTEICFNLPNLNSDYHFLDSEAGGCLRDSGIYCAALLVDLMGDIKVDKVRANFNQKDCDVYVEALLTDGKIKARMEVGYDRTKERNAYIKGTKGNLTIKNLHRPDQMIVEKDGLVQTIDLAYDHDDFYSQIHHFCQLMLENKKESPIASYDKLLKEFDLLENIRKDLLDYDESDLEILKKQQEILQYESFSNNDALILGNELVRQAESFKGKLAITIVRASDDLILFQHIMETKTHAHEGYMNGKRNCLKLTGNSSAYCYVEDRISKKYASLHGNKDYVLSAGSFPISVNGQLFGYVTVSGMHEGKDHEVIIKALEKILNKKAPDFYKALR